MVISRRVKKSGHLIVDTFTCKPKAATTLAKDTSHTEDTDAFRVVFKGGTMKDIKC